MKVNGYQGQIRAADQLQGYFLANQQIYNLIVAEAADQINYISRIGILAPAATRLKINNIIIEVGKSEVYQIDDVKITSIKFIENSSPDVIIDYIIK